MFLPNANFYLDSVPFAAPVSPQRGHRLALSPPSRIVTKLSSLLAAP